MRPKANKGKSQFSSNILKQKKIPILLKLQPRTKCSNFRRAEECSEKGFDFRDYFTVFFSSWLPGLQHVYAWTSGLPTCFSHVHCLYIDLALDCGTSLLQSNLLAACWLRNVLHPTLQNLWDLGQSQSRNSFLLPLPQTSCPQWHVTRPVSCCTLSDLHETRVKRA